MKKVLVPKVRFKGFDEEWSEEKFGELLFRINEKGYEFLETLTASKSGEMLKRKSINYHIQVAKESLKNYNRVLKNDFVLHLSTYESGLAYSKEIGITSPAYDVLRFFDKNNNDPIFFKYVFSNKKFINSLVPFTYGLRQGKSINLEELNKSLIEKTNISEQQKIGKLLDQISNLITHEEIKLNKLKQIKETLLQKMFPEGNSKIPRIRFKGFSEEWKEERLENIYSFASEGGTPDTNKDIYYKPGLFYFTKIEDMANKYIYHTKAKISELGLKNSSAWIIPKNNILFSNGATIGNVSINKVDLSTKQGIVGMIIKKKFNLEFIYYLLKSENFQSKVAEKITVGTIPTVAIFNLKKIELFLSKNIYEQQKIGDFFCKIDTLLDLYNSKLNKLKQIKEALLQKMFL
ncbi:restriction endonuclease subunit S [Mycoplasmopsis felis]|uniref:restriction endonuclease subunit S n=1 Tax=Mycoplasmopsis felis TaxID=33923 RepID=UPI002AFF6520|nr:restriction endonuclease subunit S [Mycoplasmopsis felis]WQQ06487.1 restriction endonuclease subunit S [Mycoplasmopsis felis]